MRSRGNACFNVLSAPLLLETFSNVLGDKFEDKRKLLVEGVDISICWICF